MKRMRVFCMGLACASLLTFMNINVGAAAYDGQLEPETELHMVITRASGQFSTTIKANSKMTASSTFPLEAGESVHFTASYTPDGSVDFGLIDPDGVFRYFNVTNGKIERTLKAEKNGNYTLQIRNNSSKEIKVSGYVNY